MSAEFDWDDAKAGSDLVKHGLSFETAVQVFDDPNRLEVPTLRDGDGERRFKATGVIESRLYTVIFVERNGRTRLISARRANSREEKQYGDRSLHV